MQLEFWHIVFVILFTYPLISCYESDFQLEERPVLKPDEIIYLVAKENNKIKPRVTRFSPKRHKTTTSLMLVDYEESISDSNDGDLKMGHKIWSRWGKWGECSVSCGDGVISRSRMCVAGRCAPGELEEQHRPCKRTPCVTSDVELVDAE